MAKFHHKRLKWLSTTSTGEAWKQIVKDATIGTNVDPEKPYLGGRLATAITRNNQSRNGGNCLKRITNQHKNPTDIVAGCQPNTFQMLPKYHAESWLTTPTISTSHNPRIWR